MAAWSVCVRCLEQHAAELNLIEGDIITIKGRHGCAYCDVVVTL